MAKVTINGETFDYDGSKQPMSEALWIEHVYKRRYAEWQSDLESGSAKALCLLAVLIWRRDGRNVDTAYADLLDGKTDFDLQETLKSMVDAGEASQAEAGPAAAGADPTAPGESPDPAGTRSIGTGTLPSSPANSTSGRGRSGSSTSRTSKP